MKHSTMLTVASLLTLLFLTLHITDDIVRGYRRSSLPHVHLVRVRPGVSQPVPVRRTAAQVPALLPGLGRHRGADPDAGPGDLPLGRQPQHESSSAHHARTRSRPGRRPPASTAGPRNARTAAPSPRTGCRRTPAHTPRSRSRPSPGPDRPAAATSAAACGRRPHATVRLCPASKNSATITPVAADQRLGLLPLPRPRRHRVLPVLRRHPPVEREPQTPVTPLLRPAAGALRPGRQHIGGSTRTGIATRTQCRHRSRSPLQPRDGSRCGHASQLPRAPQRKHRPRQSLGR